MEANNEYTSPEQRFFMPISGEVECHESFDRTVLPAAEIMDGEVAYAIVESAEGEEVGCIAERYTNLRSGSRIKRIVTSEVGPTNIVHLDDPEEGDFLANPVGVYEPQEGDLLILRVDTTYLPKDAKLREMMGENEIILLPAGARLPYTNGKQKGHSDKQASFDLMGVISGAEQKLLVWESGYGLGAPHLVDLCAVNAKIKNGLEQRLLADATDDLAHASLISTLQNNPAVQTYLAYFDLLKGGSYMPSEEPKYRRSEFPDMTDEQIGRYELVFNAAYAVERALSR